MLNREWGAESNGKPPHLSIPIKIAARVPVFAKDLPLSRSEALVRVCSEGPALGQNTLMMMMMMMYVM